MLIALARPAIAAALVAALAWAGYRAETYDVDTAFHCSKELARADLPPADILFVGNSRVGADIDPAYVQRLVSRDGELSVERMGIIYANIVTARMLVEDYLQFRGTPKLVVLQPMVVQAEHWQQAPGRPIHTVANTAFQPWNELTAIQQTAEIAPLPFGLPQWTAAGYRSEPAMFVERLGQQVTAGLRYLHNEPVVEYCRAAGKQRQLETWPYGDLPAKGAKLRVRSSPEKMPEAWAAELPKWKKTAPDDPARRFEIDQHLRLINEIGHAGGDVLLVNLPTNIGREFDESGRKAFERALGRPVIDVFSLLSPEERKVLSRQYRDPIHLSWEGAEVVSRRLAPAIEERVRE